MSWSEVEQIFSNYARASFQLQYGIKISRILISVLFIASGLWFTWQRLKILLSGESFMFECVLNQLTLSQISSLLTVIYKVFWYYSNNYMTQTQFYSWKQIRLQFGFRHIKQNDCQMWAGLGYCYLGLGWIRAVSQTCTCELRILLLGTFSRIKWSFILPFFLLIYWLISSDFPKKFYQKK